MAAQGGGVKQRTSPVSSCPDNSIGAQAQAASLVEETPFPVNRTGGPEHSPQGRGDGRDRRAGPSQGLIWQKLKADILELGIEFGTPLSGMSEGDIEQFLLDTAKPRLTAVLKYSEIGRRSPESGEVPPEDEKRCPERSKGFGTPSQLSTHRRHSHNVRTP